MSSCTTTVPNSVRNSAPVGQTSRQAACVQCLHTLDIISQRKSLRGASIVRPGRSDIGMPRNWMPVPGGSIVPAAARASTAGGTPGLVPVSCPVPAATTAVWAVADGPTGRAAKAAAGRGPGRGRPRVGPGAAVRPGLLDERDVPPRVGGEPAGVVVRVAQEIEAVVGN